jgi:hypothetical protein
MGFEPTTFYLEGRRSTPELHPHLVGASGLATSGSPAPSGKPPTSQTHRSKSGRVDLNHRPLEPKSSALTGLRHAPNSRQYTPKPIAGQNGLREAQVGKGLRDAAEPARGAAVQRSSASPR